MLTPAKEERDEVERLHAFRRGLATNLHEMGVPTKVIQRVCRHADEATTEEAVHPGHRTGRAERHAKAGSVDNTRETRETLNI
jgi:integrase